MNRNDGVIKSANNASSDNADLSVEVISTVTINNGRRWSSIRHLYLDEHNFSFLALRHSHGGNNNKITDISDSERKKELEDYLHWDLHRWPEKIGQRDLSYTNVQFPLFIQRMVISRCLLIPTHNYWLILIFITSEPLHGFTIWRS